MHKIIRSRQQVERSVVSRGVVQSYLRVYPKQTFEVPGGFGLKSLGSAILQYMVIGTSTLRLRGLSTCGRTAIPGYTAEGTWFFGLKGLGTLAGALQSWNTG